MGTRTETPENYGDAFGNAFNYWRALGAHFFQRQAQGIAQHFSAQ